MLPWNVVVVDSLLCERVCWCLLPLVTWSANHHHQRAHEYPTLVAKQRKFNATETNVTDVWYASTIRTTNTGKF